MADNATKYPKSVRKIGNARDNLKKAWHSVVMLHAILIDEQSNRSTKIRTAEKLSRACAQFKDLLLAGDYEERLSKIEETLKNLK